MPLRSSRKCDSKCAQIVALGPIEGFDPAGMLRRRRRVVDQLLDPRLGLVVELASGSGEQLDPVVPVGVVRGRDDRGQVEAVGAGEQQGRRRRQHTAEVDVSPGFGDARSQRGLQHRAGLARVADDQDPRAIGAERRRAGTADRHRQLGVQELAYAAADSVRAEELSGRHRHRISAWRTAAAYGPSSDRPCDVPWPGRPGSGSRGASVRDEARGRPRSGRGRCRGGQRRPGR